MADQSLKKDAGKVRLELLDFDAIDGIARVLGFGAQKYEADGWRSGMEWRRLIGAALRHLTAFARGEDIDPESGLPHLDHLGCCWMFLSAYQKQMKGTDDRVKTKQFVAVDIKPFTVTVPPPERQPLADRLGYGSFDANGTPVPTFPAEVSREATVLQRTPVPGPRAIIACGAPSPFTEHGICLSDYGHSGPYHRDSTHSWPVLSPMPEDETTIPFASPEDVIEDEPTVIRDRDYSFDDCTLEAYSDLSGGTFIK